MDRVGQRGVWAKEALPPWGRSCAPARAQRFVAICCVAAHRRCFGIASSRRLPYRHNSLRHMSRYLWDTTLGEKGAWLHAVATNLTAVANTRWEDKDLSWVKDTLQPSSVSSRIFLNKTGLDRRRSGRPRPVSDFSGLATPSRPAPPASRAARHPAPCVRTTRRLRQCAVPPGCPSAAPSHSQCSSGSADPCRAS